jgi:hypothetical protein
MIRHSQRGVEEISHPSQVEFGTLAQAERPSEKDVRAFSGPLDARNAPNGQK